MSGMNFDDLKKMIEKNEIDTVLAVFPDYFGRLLGKRLTGQFFLDNKEFFCCDYLLTAGMEMEPRSGFKMASWEKGYGDYAFVPDMKTLRVIPWLSKTAMVVCDLTYENGGPVVQSPRAILKKQCDILAQKGITPYMGSELEFHLFKGTYSDLRKQYYRNMEPSSAYKIDYHILSTSFDEPLLQKIRNYMDQAQIPIECHKGECGAGQHEIGLYYAQAVEMADRHAIYKNGIKEIAFQNAAAVTFMAKYDHNEAGSSCHVHSSLFNSETGKNLFWDEKSNSPSETFKYYLGGMLKLTREFSLLYGPTVNSYKRYCAESFAPTKIAWSYDNRTTGYRIVGSKQSYRPENRIPGADINPYLTFAGILASGIYGIENKIEPPEEFSGNAYAADDLPQCPLSLLEAATLFNNSRAARSLFGDQVVDYLVHCAFLENKENEKAVTDWELFRYFERI